MLTTTDLLRGRGVLAGIVPLFARMGAGGPAGAVIAAAVLFGASMGRFGTRERSGRRS
ncbi:MAG: hypothetical protein ACF8XB_19185 [Planctomycetota bacterium JB042]